MSTVDKVFADRLVALNGQYEDDLPVVQIVKYKNMWGGESYGLEREHEVGKYQAATACRNAEVYWKRDPVSDAAGDAAPVQGDSHE